MAKGSVQPFRLKLKKRIFKGITFLSCFDFQDDGILTHKSANIGAGQFVKIDKETEEYIKKVSMRNEYQGQIVKSDQTDHDFSSGLDPTVCMPEKKKLSNFKKPGAVESIEQDSDDEDEEIENNAGDTKIDDPNASIYKCPNEHCIKDYIKLRNLVKHRRNGLCKARLRSQTQLNHCKTMWFSRFGIADTSQVSSTRYFRTNLEDLKEIVLPASFQLLSNYEKSPLLLLTGGFKEKLEMGHAMKANQKLPKIETEVKDYIQLLFNQGQGETQASNKSSIQKYSANDVVALIHKKYPKKNWLKIGQVHSDQKLIIPF